MKTNIILVLAALAGCYIGSYEETSRTHVIEVPSQTCDDIGCPPEDLVDPACLFTGAICECRKTCLPGTMPPTQMLCQTAGTLTPAPKCKDVIGCGPNNVLDPTCYDTGAKCGCPCVGDVIACLP